MAGDDVPKKKPDPSIYRIAAERLELTPAECLVVEDSTIGLKVEPLLSAAVCSKFAGKFERTLQLAPAECPFVEQGMPCLKMLSQSCLQLHRAEQLPLLTPIKEPLCGLRHGLLA